MTRSVRGWKKEKERKRNKKCCEKEIFQASENNTEIYITHANQTKYWFLHLFDGHQDSQFAQFIGHIDASHQMQPIWLQSVQRTWRWYLCTIMVTWFVRSNGSVEIEILTWFHSVWAISHGCNARIKLTTSSINSNKTKQQKMQQH